MLQPLSRVCCWLLNYIRSLITKMSDSDVPPKPCILCKRSTRRRGVRSFLLTQDFIRINKFIPEYLNVHKVPKSEPDAYDNRMCRNCYIRSKRCHERGGQRPNQKKFEFVELANEQPENQPIKTEPTGEDIDNDSQQLIKREPDNEQVEYNIQLVNDDEIELENEENNLLNEHVNKSKPKDIEIASEKDPDSSGSEYEPPRSLLTPSRPKVPVIAIPGHSRVSTGCNRCLVAGCNSKDIHRIPFPIRLEILSKKKISIPSGARICTEHQEANVWKNIESLVRKLLNTFNGHQTEEMLNMYQQAVTNKYCIKKRVLQNKPRKNTKTI